MKIHHSSFLIHNWRLSEPPRLRSLLPRCADDGGELRFLAPDLCVDCLYLGLGFGDPIESSAVDLAPLQAVEFRFGVNSPCLEFGDDVALGEDLLAPLFAGLGIRGLIDFDHSRIGDGGRHDRHNGVLAESIEILVGDDDGVVSTGSRSAVQRS